MNAPKNVVSLRLLVLAAIFALLPASTLCSGQESTLYKTTLFSRLAHKYQDYGKSAYNFYARARSDNWPGIIRNRVHLIYGNINFRKSWSTYDDHDPQRVLVSSDSDWFSVSAGGRELTRIKDLGALQWSDVPATPFIPVTPHSTQGIRSPKPGETFEDSSEGRVTRVVAGHIYVIHVKGPEEDYYVMLRVDALVPNDNCTISWRVAPPPQGK